MKTLFFDVDTQLDFLYPAGALYVPGAEEIAPRLGELMRFAASRGIQILSSTDAHAEDDIEFKTWRPHCIAGTLGQHKDPGTLLPGAVVLQPQTKNDAPQIMVEKQVLDPFSNAYLKPLLNSMQADRYVLYGVATEICVRCAATGLLQTGAEVELVTDAIKSLSGNDEHAFIQEFQQSGGRLTTVSAVISG